jgi:hypothetical protein
MKVSNFADVGQMRRRSGISMKMMRNELALYSLLGKYWGERVGGLTGIGLQRES